MIKNYVLSRKIPYEINKAHNKGVSNYNPNKDPEPFDAKAVYNSRLYEAKPGVWYGKNQCDPDFPNDVAKYFGVKRK